MRAILIVGILVLIVGIIALAVPSFTYFTTERVADAGFFKIDVSKPHTVIINPIVGGVLLLVGAVLIFAGSRRASS